MRRLLHSPSFTFITLLTLAVGIGANTAIFSVVRGVLLKPLPYPEPDRLIGVWETAPGINLKEINASPAIYFTIREETRTLEDIALYTDSIENITGAGDPERVDSLYATHELLPMLGVKPHVGRLFTRADDTPGTPETVVLTYGYWQKRFGGDPSAVGKTIRVDGRPREIIGVLPKDFRFREFRPAMLLPQRFDRAKTFIGNFSFFGIARLKAGASLATATADVARMLPMMKDKFPPPPGMSMKMLEDARLGPLLRPFREDVVGDVGQVLWVIMGTVGIVLCIACANVANLLLVRADGRQHELAIRAALGAGWGRIAGELLRESMTLALAGGALAVAVAYGAIRLLVHLGPSQLPRLDEISIDWTVLLFTFAISLLSGLLFGLLPVYKYAGARLGYALRDGSRSVSEGRERHRVRNTLVVVQVALALVLLVSSGLMIRTALAMRQVRPGFTHPEQLFTFRVSIPEAQVPKPEQVVEMHHEILRKVQALPGVESASMVNSVTMDGNHNNDPIFAEDRVYSESQLPPLRRYKFIAPGLGQTMGNPLVAGRDVSWTDINEKRLVVLVSENLARELWGSPAAAVGKRVRETPKSPWREVIGVMGDERDNGVDQKAPTIVYWPMIVPNMWQMPVRVSRTLAYVVRSSRAGTSSLTKEAAAAVWSVNSDLPVADVRTVQDIFNRSMARTSFTLVMLSLAAGMALLLGLVGIYGVISYSISQRTREIGIRMALGAQRERIRQMFVGHGIKLAGVGIVCGAVAAVALTRLMKALLFEVSPVDPITYAAVATVLVGAAWLASYVPSRRATTIAPVEALRSD